MSIPPGARQAARTVAGMVRDIFPVLRRPVLTDEEKKVAVHLRGNQLLYEDLTGLIQTRIEGRANLPEPSDPLVCKSMISRDRELQWLLSTLERIYRAPVLQTEVDDGEQPE